MEVRHYSDRAAIAANQNVKEREYWLRQLSGDPAASRFPYDRSAAETEKPGESNLAAETFHLPDDLVLKLEKISGGIDIKLHIVLVAGLVLLLNKYTGNRDILTGAPVLKQESEADFINCILAFRTWIDDDMTFKDLLLHVRETIIAAAENQNFPFEVLPDLLKIPIVENEFPLFDVVLLLENIHAKNYLGDIHYKMLFSFSRVSRRIELVIEYQTLRYTQRMIKQIAAHFIRLLDQTLSDLNTRLIDVDLLSEQERRQLLEEFNAADMDFFQDRTFQRSFEEQVEKTPENIAVVAQNTGGACSYRLLNEKANRVARVLRDRGVTRETVVSIMADRSVEMIVGVLAVLKAGGAYLPIDPQYPIERIEFLLLDSSAALLVTQAHLRDQVNFEGSIIVVEEYQDDAAHSINNPEPVNRPGDLVYVIYTSGSTGKPKGVMVQHDHFMNLAYGCRKAYRLQEMTVILLQMASFSFDVFAEDLARTFLNGGKMVITPALAVEPEILYELITTHQVTIFESTPSYIIPFMQYIYENRLTLDHLQLVIMGADVCPARDFKELVTRFGKQMRIVNSYGVTEATIDSSYYEEYNLEKLPAHGSVPIGKPLPNVKFYILDARGKPLPVGVPGELYIGGKGVTRGYLLKMELTAERFIINPLSLVISCSKLPPNDRLYKTGDLARWLPDGNVEFSGRIDSQVKIRGYRIELGEIESRLLQHPDVREAVVVEKGETSGDKYLCAYFVSDKNQDPTELREFLGRKLPEYMVPWFFIRLEKLPLSANGKIDRKALPEIQPVEKREYAPPRNKTDEQLIEIWSRILAVDKEKIGIDDNFFDLGGNSLKAIIIASYMHKQFAVRIQLVDIFQIQTIRGIAEFIKESEQEEFAGLRPYEKKDYYASSSAQARLYILQQLELENTSYNIPLVLKLTGELDKERFEETFKKLLDRHESLRTSFTIIANGPAQIIRNAAAVEFKIEYYELAQHDEEVVRTRLIPQFTRPFDLSQAPLFRAGIIEITPGEHILMVDMHHIMSDLFSHGILVHDFLVFYDRQELLPLKLQYKDFSEWQNGKAEQDRIKRQAEYWLGEFQGKLPVLNLPTDFPRPGFQGFSGAVFCFEIEQGQSAALRALARQEGVTGHILLLAVFFILMAKLSDQEDIIVGTPIAGRSHADLENMIGVFINILAIRSFPQRQKTFLEFLSEVKAKCLLSYENQDYPFEDLVKQAALERDMSRSPLFDVIFEVQQRGRQATGVKAAPARQEPRLNFSYYPMENKTTKFDLDWVAVDTGETILFSVNYCTDLFKEETVELMSQAYRVLLEEIIRNNECKIVDLEYCLPHDADTGRQESEAKNIEFKFQ